MLDVMRIVIARTRNEAEIERIAATMSAGWRRAEASPSRAR